MVTTTVPVVVTTFRTPKPKETGTFTIFHDQLPSSIRRKVLIGKIVPAGSAVRQTLEGRRRRFRMVLAEIVTGLGWRVVGPNIYEGPPLAPSSNER